MSTNNPNPLTQAALPSSLQLAIQALQERLAHYQNRMKPGVPVEPEEGSNYQSQLWNTIKFVLGKQGTEFTVLYTELLKFVQENRQGVCSERYVYRFLDRVKMSSPERRNFERMLNLLLTTSDPRTRFLALRQVDLRTTLAGFADNNLQQRVMGFYQI